VESAHFDQDAIVAKKVNLVERYKSLTDPIKAKRSKLGDALRYQQFVRDVEDEEDWIREKEPIAASTNRGMFLEDF
jgi:spectrin alpha